MIIGQSCTVPARPASGTVTMPQKCTKGREEDMVHTHDILATWTMLECNAPQLQVGLVHADIMIMLSAPMPIAVMSTVKCVCTFPSNDLRCHSPYRHGNRVAYCSYKVWIWKEKRSEILLVVFKTYVWWEETDRRSWWTLWWIAICKLILYKLRVAILSEVLLCHSDYSGSLKEVGSSHSFLCQFHISFHIDLKFGHNKSTSEEFVKILYNIHTKYIHTYTYDQFVSV